MLRKWSSNPYFNIGFYVCHLCSARSQNRIAFFLEWRIAKEQAPIPFTPSSRPLLFLHNPEHIPHSRICVWGEPWSCPNHHGSEWGYDEAASLRSLRGCRVHGSVCLPLLPFHSLRLFWWQKSSAILVSSFSPPHIAALLTPPVSSVLSISPPAPIMTSLSLSCPNSMSSFPAATPLYIFLLSLQRRHLGWFNTWTMLHVRWSLMDKKVGQTTKSTWTN